MKIGTKLVFSFLVVALLILFLIMMNWTIMENVSKQSLIEEYAHELSKNIYFEETIADTYVRRAASANFEIEENTTEVEAIAQEFYQVHNNNSVLIGKINEVLSTDEEKEIMSTISNKHEEVKSLFVKNHHYYELKIYNLARQNETGVKIADMRHDLKVILEDPVYFQNFSKRIAFYSSASKTIENKNVLTIFRQLGYKEKEYVWQYRDKKHLDDVLAVVAELEAINAITDVPEATKSKITSILSIYINYSTDFLELIEENDLDRLSAIGSKYSRDLFFLREDELSKKYVYDPKYGDRSKQFKIIMVGSKERRVSLEYLLFELGHHEKEVLYQDKGIRTTHYNEILETYDSINTIIMVLQLSESDIDNISSTLTKHKNELDGFMEIRSNSEKAIKGITEEKTIKITEMRKVFQEIQEGNGDTEKRGLNYLADIQGAITKTQTNNLNMVNLIGGLLIVLIATFIGLYVPYSISRPLKDLSNKADEIGRGNLNVQIDVASDDEIGELSKSFQKMAEDLQKTTVSKDYVENIIGSMFEMLIVTTPDGTIQRVNRAVLDVLGYTEEELVGQPVNKIFEDESLKISNNLFENGASGVEKTYRSKDGRMIYMLFSGSVMHNREGNVQGMVYVAKDITERKKMEEKLAFISKAKSEFLADMSHELRTPLNSVIGFSELLKLNSVGELNQKQQHYVDNVLTSSKFLLNLINDILDLSKVEAGKIELVIEQISVPEMINETLTLIKEKATTHHVVLKNELEEDLPVIQADRMRFKQVLFNLLSNAMKFSKPGGGSVTISARRDGEMIRVSVSDTGIGIREEDMDKLFNTFEQLDPVITQKYGGSGLGLAITKKLVELHGGKIWVKSSYGIGTTFYFTLPLVAKKTEKVD